MFRITNKVVTVTIKVVQMLYLNSRDIFKRFLTIAFFFNEIVKATIYTNSI